MDAVTRRIIIARCAPKTVYKTCGREWVYMFVRPDIWVPLYPHRPLRFLDKLQGGDGE